MYEHKGRERPAKSGHAAEPVQAPARPEWIDSELDNAQTAGPRLLSLDAITGGKNMLIASRSVYARASAFAWAVWSALLALSMVMPDAYPDSNLSWWMVLLGGLAIAAGIFFANFEAQSKGHMVTDALGLVVLAAVLALTGGLESTMTPLFLLLVASQAWFWQTRLVALRIAGPVVVALSPLFYDQLGTGQAYWIPLITLVGEVMLIAILVLAMFYDRWLIAQLHDRAEQLSLIDPLTGISNRRAFDAFVQDLIDEHESPGEFAVVMIDLDNFKQVNTSLGHLAGDQVLKAIAAALESVGREDDCIARVGGDEFAAVLPDVGIEGARALAERFVETVASTPSARGAQVGASAGFALYPLHGESLDQLMFTADDALMSVKESGKGSARVARAIQAL
jgi:diguanylate cyclase (GGDEF)-like protein